jgi:hypothetical protein
LKSRYLALALGVGVLLVIVGLNITSGAYWYIHSLVYAPEGVLIGCPYPVGYGKMSNCPIVATDYLIEGMTCAFVGVLIVVLVTCFKIWQHRK